MSSIEVSDSRRAPKPVRTFLEAAFPDYILATIEALGLNEPTPIQSQAWPAAMSGHDLIGLASTGSGKTLGFALPAFVHILAQERRYTYQLELQRLALDVADGEARHAAAPLARRRQRGLHVAGALDGQVPPKVGVANTVSSSMVLFESVPVAMANAS